MDEVVFLPVYTFLPVPPERVLTYAVDRVKEVLVIGWTTEYEEEGGVVEEDQFYFASSTSDLTEILYLLKLAQMRVEDMIREKEFGSE